MPKTRVCFVATNKSSCDQIGKQLEVHLGQFIAIDTWSLHEVLRPEILDNDIFIAGTKSIFAYISPLIPPHKKIIVASRTLDSSNLDELLLLPPGTEVLVASNWKDSAYEKIALLKSFALDKLVLYPYWTGNTTYPCHVKLAITTGNHAVPPEIERIIDLGPRTLDLSTFVELIDELELPREVINYISARYIAGIINSTTRRLAVAAQNEKLKQGLEAILDTVDQGIIAVDATENIILFNPAAEKMLRINTRDAVGRPIKEVIPELAYVAANSSAAETIQKIGSSHYIITTTPIRDAASAVSGVVFGLKAATAVQELDSKVRRELKRTGDNAKYHFNDIVGASEKIVHAISMARQFADTNLTILIEGESGTGKELFAQAIHNASRRSKAPFVAINFAAFPENLVESELFGYEEGAFTGARKGGKAGLFEEAHTGTIFLDEIGDTSLEVQKRLLRVLEEKEVRRVGGNTVTPVDVRVVAATNQNLLQLVDEGKFRKDLYFRLCVIQIAVPPLRQRRKDIPVLIDFFAKKLYRRQMLLDDQVRDSLLNCRWEGNIRELQNIVNFLCGIVNTGETVKLRHLPDYLLARQVERNEKITAAPISKDAELIISEFSRENALAPLQSILAELARAEKFDRCIGRGAVINALAAQPVRYSGYKIRLWLKRLEQGGCITPGVTKQGSCLTSLGYDVLSILRCQAPG